MLVMKFGGTSVADAQPIARAADIVARARGPRVVVVSAFAGVTDRLLQMAACAEAGRLDVALALLHRIKERHRQVAAALVGDLPADLVDSLERTAADLDALVRAASVLRHVAPRSLDAIAAAGELLSSRIVAAAFERHGVASAFVDARRVIVTDSHHGEAAPIMDITAHHLATKTLPLIDDDCVPVIGGFIGATAEGVTTTLGRGGSDLTAAIVGASLGAREIQIWTDVGGVRAADPRIVPDAHQVTHLTFAEARELAYFGAKVLHPATVEPAVACGIPIVILNSRKPDAAGTVINGATSHAVDGLAALACKRAVAVVEASPLTKQRPETFLRAAFEALELAGVHPCMTTVADGVVVSAFDDERRARAAAHALDGRAQVKVRVEMALLAAVGENLSGVPRLTAEMLSAVDGLAVHAVSQPPSGRSLTLLMDDADVAEGMCRVYERFLGSRDVARNVARNFSSASEAPEGPNVARNFSSASEAPEARDVARNFSSASEASNASEAVSGV